MTTNCKPGRRREGMFSSVKGFALKAAQALTFGLRRLHGYRCGIRSSGIRLTPGGLDDRHRLLE